MDLRPMTDPGLRPQSPSGAVRVSEGQKPAGGAADRQTGTNQGNTRDGEHEAILDRLLADDPPELQTDPAYREQMRGTFAYQSAVLDAELRKLGRAGARKADKLARRHLTILDRALRRAMPGLLPPAERRRWWRRHRG